MVITIGKETVGALLTTVHPLEVMIHRTDFLDQINSLKCLLSRKDHKLEKNILIIVQVGEP